MSRQTPWRGRAFTAPLCHFEKGIPFVWRNLKMPSPWCGPEGSPGCFWAPLGRAPLCHAQPSAPPPGALPSTKGALWPGALQVKEQRPLWRASAVITCNPRAAGKREAREPDPRSLFSSCTWTQTKEYVPSKPQNLSSREYYCVQFRNNEMKAREE